MDKNKKTIRLTENELVSLIKEIISEDTNDKIKSGLITMADNLIETFPNELKGPIKSAFQKSIESGNANDLIKAFPPKELLKFMKIRPMLERKLSKLSVDSLNPEIINNIGVESADSIGEKCQRGDMSEQVALIWGLPVPLWNRCLNILIKLAILFCIYYTFWYVLSGNMRQH